nr:PH domain-containing protein [Candidatus Freyarchaeota archaeon]
MVYVDKPKPGNGYLSFFIIVALILPAEFLILFTFLRPVALEVTSIFFPWEQDLRNLFIVFLIYYLPLLLLVVIAIHAAYNTEYRIENGELWMKHGYIGKRSVSLDEIKSIEKLEFIRGKPGHFIANRFYSNRFKNGIRIITENRIILVSPGNIERFISELGLKTGR